MALTPSQLQRSTGIGTDIENPPPPRVKRGRPSTFAQEQVEKAKKLALLGATDIEIADFFEISVRQLYVWKQKHPDFAQSLKEGKDDLDNRVERSLYHRAVGYTFDSEKVFNNDGKITRVKTREHVPPDNTSMIFWLKNRQPANWRDQKDVNVAGSIEVTNSNDRELALAVLAAIQDGVRTPLTIDGEVENVE